MTRLLFRLAVRSTLLLLILNLQPLLAQDAHQLKIGFSIEAMNGERWQTDLDSFETTARQLGAEVISADAKGNDDLQLRQVNDMIKAGIAVLVLLPRDTAAGSRMVDAAKSANVKVISYDRLILNSNVDLYVSFDRVEIGQMQAEYLLSHKPKGNYVLIAGSPNDQGAKTLHDAQMKVLQPSIDRGDIKVIADGYMKEWIPTEAYLFAVKAIDSSQGDIAAILTSNDGLASGAIEALHDHHLNGKVLVSGQDADLMALISIVRGDQAMTVYKPVTIEAAKAAEAAVHMAKGEKPQANSTTNNGKAMVPTIMLKPVLVTKENIKTTVVKDGFQKLSSINRELSPDQQIN